MVWHNCYILRLPVQAPSHSSDVRLRCLSWFLFGPCLHFAAQVIAFYRLVGFVAVSAVAPGLALHELAVLHLSQFMVCWAHCRFTWHQVVDVLGTCGSFLYGVALACRSGPVICQRASHAQSQLVPIVLLFFIFGLMAAALGLTLVEFVKAVEFEGKTEAWDEWAVKQLVDADITVRTFFATWVFLVGMPFSVAGSRDDGRPHI